MTFYSSFIVQKQNTSSHHNGPSVYPYGSPPPSQSHSSSLYSPPPPPSRQSSGDTPVGAPHSAFPPGTDPNVITGFQLTDRDDNGFIDDKELQLALSSDNQSSLSTVHLLMYLSTNTNNRKIGPKEFTEVYYNLQNYKKIFERFDRDRSGKIGVLELGEALLSLGLSVSPVVLDLLVSKFVKSSGETKAIEYDNFVGCCLTVKGLTEKFKKEPVCSDSATFTYEPFMSTVLPFLLA